MSQGSEMGSMRWAVSLTHRPKRGMNERPRGRCGGCKSHSAQQRGSASVVALSLLTVDCNADCEADKGQRDPYETKGHRLRVDADDRQGASQEDPDDEVAAPRLHVSIMADVIESSGESEGFRGGSSPHG